MKHRGLEQLVGLEVSSVEFVRDYVQIRFDGPCLSAFSFPAITVNSELVIDRSNPRYADILIERIGKVVEFAEFEENEAVRLGFSDGILITISLRPEDYRAAEAATLVTEPGRIYSW